MRRTRTSCRGHPKRIALVYSIPHTFHSRREVNDEMKPLHTVVYPCSYALFWAAYWCEWDLFIALISAGSDTTYNRYNSSVLSWVILGLSGDSVMHRGVNLLKLIVDAGANCNEISDTAIRKVLHWDRKTRHIVTDAWSQETVDHAKLLPSFV